MYIMYLLTCGGCTQSFINGQNGQKKQTGDLYETWMLHKSRSSSVIVFFLGFGGTKRR